MGRRVGVRLAAAGVLDAGNVAAVDDGPHAGDGSCLAVVDLDDTGVGVGAGQQPGVEHAAHLDVIDKRRVALGQLDGVDLRLGLAHNLRLRAGVAVQHKDGVGLRVRCRAKDAVGRRVGRLRHVALAVAVLINREGGDEIAGVDHFGIDARRRLLAAQDGGGAQYGQHRPQVARLAAQDAR